VCVLVLLTCCASACVCVTGFVARGRCPLFFCAGLGWMDQGRGPPKKRPTSHKFSLSRALTITLTMRTAFALLAVLVILLSVCEFHDA
jgi:hypothetical protein